MELKVYISGKITGENYVSCKVKFLAMQVRLLAMNVHTVINPMNLGITEKWSWDEAMERCMRVLKENANAIVMLDDYADNKGALRELEYARDKKYLIVFEHEVDDIFTLARERYKLVNTPPPDIQNHTWKDTSDIEFP